MQVTILENGNLELSLESDDDGVCCHLRDADYRDDNKLCDLLEPYSCNGSFAYFDAGDANPYVGLTDAPCIAEQLDYLDDGTIEIVGKFWYYDDYMIKSYIVELLENGKVIFTYGGE